MANVDVSRLGQGVRNMMLLVIFQRLLNFTINQLLMRKVDPDVLGLALLRCDLMLSTTLFLGREGLRLALVRQAPGSPSNVKDRQKLVNLAWCSAPIGIILAIVVAIAYVHFNFEESSERKYTAMLYCAGGAAESLVEPLFILAQANMRTGIRASAEGAAALIRGASTYICLVWFNFGVISFGIAQLLYGLTIAFSYVSYTYSNPAELGLTSPRDLLPRKIDRTSWLEATPLRLAGVFTFQSIFKHCLTEGDRIVLSMGSSLHDQGVYIMAQNYGSLAVRVLLQPLEEASRLLFSKMGAELVTSDKKDDITLEMLQVLQLLLKAVSMLGLVFLCFGVNYVGTMLVLLPGERWSSLEAVSTLRWYCVYILCLALNGTLEAFVYATADSSQVGWLTGVHSACSVLFALLALPLMQRIGTAGIVAANCGVMVVRIAYSANVTFLFFKRRGVRMQLLDSLPKLPLLISFLIGGLLTAGSEQHFINTKVIGAGLKAEGIHIGFGGLVFFGVLVVIGMFERSNLMKARRLISDSKKKSD